MASYLDDVYGSPIATARALIAGNPLLASLAGQSDAAITALATAATSDIDVSMRFNGRKYDQTQTLEFPRIDASPAARQYPPAPPSINDPSFYIFGGSPTFIFDWDPNANGGLGGAVVPANIQMATLYQMAWLLQPKFANRLEAIRSGLVGQGIGTASEAYAKNEEIATQNFGLCDRATRLCNKYRLGSGRRL